MVEFQVKDMSCGGCIKAVTKSVQSVDASAQVEVNLAQQRIKIHSNADLAALQAAIVGAGFPVLGSSLS